MRIKVHVQGWHNDHAVDPGEEPNVLINGILEVDGTLIEDVSKVQLVLQGGDFVSVQAHFIPGSFEVITHDTVTWPTLLADIRQQKEQRGGAGRVIAAQ